MSSVASYPTSLLTFFLPYDSALNMAATAGKTGASTNGVLNHGKAAIVTQANSTVVLRLEM
jgi:hypothetical protein